MKLDMDCIRDVLLVLEDWLVLNEELDFISLDLDEICRSSAILKYTRPDVAYALIILKEAGFIEATINYSSDTIDEIDVIRLTFQGHQFLDSIRPQATWDKIYAVSEKTGLKSVNAIMEIADILLPETIKSALHS